MNAARKKTLSEPHATKEREVIVIASDSEDISSNSSSQNPAQRIDFHRLINERLKNKEKNIKDQQYGLEQAECIDLNSTSLTYRDENESKTQIKNRQLTYEEVLVKNPDYTNYKKLAKNQKTLDSFITDFRQSKYLKTNKIKKNKYRQLTILDYKKDEKEERH